jgi:TP901 family phage tail tape measure protein
VALSKDVVIRLLGDASSAQAAIKAAADAAEVSVAAYKRAEREQQRQADTARQAAQDQIDMQAQAADAMEGVAQAAMASGAVVAAGLALSAKAAIDWQSAWADVNKSVEGTPAQMDELEGSLRNLATTLPVTHEEIAGVAAAAGQLGIARGDIVEFTKVAVALGVSTNLSSEEAATGLAQLSNIMGTSSGDVDRLGSTLVGLGNAGASTESDILAMSLRIAAAGKQSGMSEADVMGLANALSSMGVNAEAGGSSVSTVIKDINNAVLEGNTDLNTYAATAGMTAEEFSTAWRNSAAGGLAAFAAGLGRVQESGGNVNQVLKAVGLTDLQVSDTMLRMSSNAGLVSQSLATGNQAWADNNALMNEANKRYATVESQLQIASNAINDAAIDIGTVLLPVVSTAAGLVADFARGFGDLPGWMQGSVAIIGLLSSTLLLAGGAFTLIGPKLAAFRLEMVMLTYSSSTAQAAVGRMGAFMMGPWGIALGVATLAIGGLVTWLGASGRASESAAGYQKDLAAALRESKGAITDNIRALAAQKAADEQIGNSNLLEIAQRAGVSLPRLTDALLGNRDAYNEVRGALAAYQAAHTHDVTRETNAGIHQTTTRLDEQGIAAEAAGNALGDLGGAMGGAVAENERLAAATAESGDAAGGATTTTDSLTTAVAGAADASDNAASKAQDLADVLKGLNQPTLDARDAARQYQEALDAATEAVATNGRTLDINTEAGRANQAALDDIARAAMDQANAIVNSGGSYDAFRGSLQASREALIATAKDMGMTQDEAVDLANKVLAIPDASMVNIGIPTYAQVTGQLIDVNNKVRSIPPQTWTNVGVISQAAIDQLNAVGIKTRTLPDGTVEVYADTVAARNELNALVNKRWIATVTTNVSGLFGFGARQTGGPLAPGQVAWVGESGPELFQAGPAGGFVTPAGLSRAVTAAMPAGTPVGPSVRMDPTPAPAAAAPIDYGRLGAAVAAAVGRSFGVNIGSIVTQRNETGYELAERLAFTARTAGA